MYLGSRRHYGYGLALVLAAYLFLQIAREGLAVILTQQAEDEYTLSLPDGGAPYSGLQAAQRHLTEARQFSPANSWVREKSGQIQLYLSLESSRPVDALNAAHDAVAFFRGALQGRPTSPYLWANLARAKLYAGEEDREILDALRNAAELGPWEPEVLHSVVYVGLAIWDSMDATARSVVMHALTNSARISGSESLALAKEFDRLDLVCQVKELVAVDTTLCASRFTR